MYVSSTFDNLKDPIKRKSFLVQVSLKDTELLLSHKLLPLCPTRKGIKVIGYYTQYKCVGYLFVTLETF